MAEQSQVPDLPVSNVLGSFGSLPAPASMPVPGVRPDLNMGAGVPVAGVRPEPTLTQTKQAAVQQASEAKRALLGGPQDMKRLATAIQQGNDLGSDPMIQTMLHGSNTDVMNQYGQDVLDRLPALHQAIRELDYNGMNTRTADDVANDTTLGAVSGAIAGVGGLAALGTGFFSDRGGAAVSEATNGITTFLADHQSDTLKQQKADAAVRAQLEQEDINRKYAKEVSNGTDYAGLRRLGREVVSGAKDLAAHPSLATDLTAEGIGSLAVAGPMGKMLKVGSKAFPLITGALEAGGSYTDVQQQIQGMNHDQLMAGSPAYRALIAQGKAPDEAKNRIANEAGMEGAAIAGVAGALSGGLTAKFESAPLHALSKDGFVGSLRELGTESLKEAAEESFQGASGGIATNMGIKDYADQNRDVTEGLGQQIVQGGIAGLGSVGPLQLPHVAFAAGASGLSATGAALSRIGEGVQTAAAARMANVEAAKDAASPVGTMATSAAIDTVKTQLAAAQQALEPAAAPVVEPAATPEQAAVDAVAETPVDTPVEAPVEAPATAAAEPVAETTPVETPAEAAPTEAPVETKAAPQTEDLKTRIVDALQVDPKAIMLSIRELEKSGSDPQALTEAGLELRDFAETLQGLRREDLSVFPEAVATALKDSHEAINTILSNPVVSRAIERAATSTTADLGERGSIEITPENVASPEVQRVVQNVDRVAKANPAGVDPKFVNHVLNQRKGLNLSDDVAARLKAAGAMAQEMQQNQETQAALVEQTKAELTQRGMKGKPLAATDVIRKGSLETGGNAKYQQLSLNQHQAEITTAIGNGKTVYAQERLDALRNFAEHMQNKVKAARESAALNRSSDNGRKFRTWTGKTWVNADQKGAGSVFINPNSPVGTQLLKSIEADEKAVSAVYNSLIDIYGGWRGVKGVKISPIDQENTGNVEPVTSVSLQPKGADNASPDAGTAEAKVDQGSQDQTGDTQESTDQADTAPAQDAGEDGNAGTPADDTAPGPGTDARGTGDEPAAGADPEPVKAPSFNNLPKGKQGFSRFLRAFKINPAKSKLMSHEAPARFVMEALRDKIEDLPYAVDDGQLAAWSKLIKEEGSHILNRLNARLQEASKNTRNTAPIDLLDQALTGKAATDWLSARDTMGLNMVDTVSKKYDATLSQAAMLAALHWTLTTPSSQNLSDKEVADIFGIDISMVDSTMRNAVNTGIGAKPAVESLAKTIRTFWGAEVNHKAPMSDVRGLSEHMAAELLTVMVGEGGRMGTMETIQIKKPDQPPLDTNVIKLKNDATKELRKTLMGSKNLLADAFVPDGDKPFYFGKVPDKPHDTQKKNPFSRLGAKMKAALQMQRETPLYRNTNQVALMKELGEDLWFDLMGYVGLEPEHMNKVHRDSAEGRNNTIRDSWEGVMEYDAQLEGFASKQGLKADEVPVYMDYNAVSNERMMAEGFNPQSDKGMREAAVATRSVLNLADAKQNQFFWLTVGQSSGIVKTEKGTRANNAETAETKVRAKYPETLSILKSWLTDPETGISTEDKAAMKAEIQLASPKLMHSLMAVARYDIAISAKPDSDEVTKFTHDLSLEADGKTDGPINAIMHFTRGVFTTQQILHLRRGGWFPNEQGMTLNAQAVRDNADLYEVTGQLANTNFATRRQKFMKNTQTAPVMAAVDRVLRLLGDVKIADDGTIQLTRAGVKNPLTITGYGSGENGIAGKITNLMLDKLYEKLTELEQAKIQDPLMELTSVWEGVDTEQLKKDLKTLTSRRIAWNKFERKYVVLNKTKKDQTPPPMRNLEKGKDFDLSPEQFQMLQENMRYAYVKPMVEAIDEVFGNVGPTMKLFQAATQLQSAVMMAHFQQTVEETLAAKRTNGELEKNEFLSTEDYDNIFKKLAKFGAIIEPVATDANSLNLSGAESVRTNRDFSRTYDGKFGGSSTLMEPGNAGVSASPMLTISRGDAQMMVNFYAAKGAKEFGANRTLQVYDGLEMPADLIETLSEKINQAVAEGWLENPVQDMADSFADWVRQGKNGPLGDLSETALNAIAENLDMMPEQLPAYMMSTQGELAELARETQARKNTLKRIGFSTDHMASGETPHYHEGETWNGEGKFIDWMNQIYEEELAKLPSEEDLMQPKAVIEVETNALKERIAAYATDVSLPGSDEKVSRMRVQTLLAALDTDLVKGELKPILAVMRKVIPDFAVLFGTSKGLTEYRDVLFPEQAGEESIPLGQTDNRTGVIYIANTSGETIVHELLHAVLAKILTDHYAQTVQLSETQLAAIKNLEKLMTQFADMNFSNEHSATRTVAEAVQAEIRSRLGENLEYLDPTYDLKGNSVLRRAGAMSEFLAWSLTNQNLKEVLSVSKVKSPLKRLKDMVLSGLKTLLGLPREQRMDMFSNIKWNAGALIRTLEQTSQDEMDASMPSGLVSNQINPHASPSTRMRNIRMDFEAKIGAHLKAMPIYKSDPEKLAIYTLADQSINRFRAAGFVFNPEQESTFRVMQAALASSMHIAPGAMAQTQKIFQNFIKDLTVESLMKDPTDMAERVEAENRFDAIVGKSKTETDPQGRSNLMASVMALAMVDEDFRKVLEKSPLPADRKISYASVDDFLNSFGDSMMNTLGTVISEEGRGMGGLGSKNANTREAIEQLAQVIARIEKDDRSQIEKHTETWMDKGDALAVSMMEKAGAKLNSLGSRMKNGTTVGDGIGSSLRVLGDIIGKGKGQSIVEAMVGFSNESSVPRFMKELLAEVVGMTDTNKGAYQLLNRVKAKVSAMRQDYREKMPEIFAKQFSRKLSKTEWSILHALWGKTDIAALGDSFTGQDIRELISDPAKLTAALQKAQASITAETKTLGSTFSKTMVRKADELARFMATGEIDAKNHNLLKNALAIGSLLGETGQKVMERQKGPSKALVQAIEHYTSLKSLELSKTAKPEAWAQLEKLVKDEPTGIDFLLYSLVDLRKNEAKRLTTPASRLNAWKGYIPEEAADGARLMVADDREHNRLITMGFTRVGDYKGSGYESGRRSYYFSTVGGNNSYSQGVLQTVQMTAMGTDPRTGRNTHGVTAGAISGVLADQITHDIATNGPSNPNQTGEALIPVYDGTGNVVAYERSMKPEMRAKMNRNTHLGEMMGAWAGRQEEERVAEAFNELLIDQLHKAWVEGKRTGRAKEFVNMADPGITDKVFGESWAMVPPATREYIDKVYANEPGFMIREDMINNTMGYRLPSVKDAWEGASRVHPHVQKAIRDTATLLLGAKAVPWLVTAEKAWQAGIAVAKHTIVVKSVIVPLSNIASNVTQLMSKGVPLRIILSGFSSKLVEIAQYQRNLDRAIEIKTQMARHRGNASTSLKLKAQLKNLEDSNRRMSIWPVIEAGEFSTISEGPTEVDAAIQNGKWVEYIQNSIDKLPLKLGTIGRYAIITKDTALFQGMSRATQYGDFLAKAVLYDHMVKTKKTDSKKALETITEEFVNYNFMPGRVRSYAESMGLTWFWAYKLRSVKVALKTLKTNPLRALLTSYGAQYMPDLPGVSVGSPVTDNAVGVILGGRSSYSLGLDMLWSAPSLNPWMNMMH